ncbi:MAG: adenylyl cyclase, partial [Gammaproteobacteria bacterium]
MGQTGSFFSELRRRNVFRVGVAYAIVAWLVVEISSVVFPALNLPDWTLTFFIVLFIIGFPFALIFAWAYELTPEGLKKEKDVDRSQSITTRTGRKLDFIIIGVMAVAIAYFLVDKFVWVSEEAPTGVAVSEERPSVAVLPFANRSANEEDAFFVDGI